MWRPHIIMSTDNLFNSTQEPAATHLIASWEAGDDRLIEQLTTQMLDFLGGQNISDPLAQPTQPIYIAASLRGSEAGRVVGGGAVERAEPTQAASSLYFLPGGSEQSS